MQVVLLPIQGAENYTQVTFVPISFCTDDAERPQWSHLIEHLLIASVPDATPEQVNAEASAIYTHLDWMRPAGQWREAAALHAGWMASAEFADAAVEREKRAVLEEIDQLCAAGATSKLALSAWTQVMLFDARKVEVKAALQAASGSRLTEYCREKMLAGRSPVVVVAGQFVRDDVLSELEERMGALQLRGEPSGRASHRGVRRRARWDLPAAHAIFSWPLGDLSPERRAAVLVAQNALFGLWPQVPSEVRVLDSQVIVDLVRIEGQDHLLVNLALTPAGLENLDAARREVQEALRRLLDEPVYREQGRRQLIAQWDQISRPSEAVNQAVQRGLPRPQAEARIAVAIGMLEFRHAGLQPELLEFLRAADPSEERVMLSELLAESGRCEVVLAPAQPATQPAAASQPASKPATPISTQQP